MAYETIKGCIILKDLHYSVLSNPDNNYQVKMNDQLFNFCSNEKLDNPIKWLQMQWIRPEDISVYAQEGFNHFKLTSPSNCKQAKLPA